MGNELNPNSNNGRNISSDRAFNAPKIKPENLSPEKIEANKEVAKKPETSNLSFSIYGLNPVSSNEKADIEDLAQSSDRSGPGNLPGRSSVHYDLSEVDLDDYDDNSFTL